MKKLSSTFRFSAKASYPKNAVTVVYDLEGFSRLLNQGDAQDHVPTLLNIVSEAVSICLLGGATYWVEKDKESPITPIKSQLAYEKFLGDGALYVLLPESGESDFFSINFNSFM